MRQLLDALSLAEQECFQWEDFKYWVEQEILLKQSEKKAKRQKNKHV